MKTAIILSCLFAGASLMLRHQEPNSSVSVPVYHSVKARRSFADGPIAPIRIVISKSDYQLLVYDAKGWYATYPVVFGNSSLDDKKMEGDKNTPEGDFKIVNKRVHDKWDRYMGLDYPTRESLEKFNARKRRGEIPSWAKPGAGVGIHGTWPHEDFVVDRYNNWTDGCISLKRQDIEELYTYVPVGTPVSIHK